MRQASRFFSEPAAYWSYHIGADIAHDIEDLVVGIHGILEVMGSVVEFAGIGIVAFLELDDAAHQRMSQMELQVGIVCIEISHYFEFFL